MEKEKISYTKIQEIIKRNKYLEAEVTRLHSMELAFKYNTRSNVIQLIQENEQLKKEQVRLQGEIAYWRARASR